MTAAWQGTPVISPLGITAGCEERAMFAGEGPNNPLAIEDRYAYATGQLRNAAASAIIKNSPGFLKGISLGVLGTLATATHLVIFDNIAASGTVAAYIPLANRDFIECDFEFYSGLTIATVALSLDGAGNLAGGTAVITPAVTWAINYNCIYR